MDSINKHNAWRTDGIDKHDYFDDLSAYDIQRTKHQSYSSRRVYSTFVGIDGIQHSSGNIIDYFWQVVRYVWAYKIIHSRFYYIYYRCSVIISHTKWHRQYRSICAHWFKNGPGCRRWVLDGKQHSTYN